MDEYAINAWKLDERDGCPDCGEYECQCCGSTDEPIAYESNGSDGISKSIECSECGDERGF